MKYCVIRQTKYTFEEAFRGYYSKDKEWISFYNNSDFNPLLVKWFPKPIAMKIFKNFHRQDKTNCFDYGIIGYR